MSRSTRPTSAACWRPLLAAATALTALVLPTTLARAAGAPSEPQVAAQANQQGWLPLFDGTLDGWKANENAASFALDGKELVVKGERGHLFYVGPVNGAEFTNFELEVEALTKQSANSGVFFHTRWQDDGWPAHGYEAQVNSTHGDEIKSGSLYGVVKVNPAPTVDDQWYTMNLRVVGRRITVRIDGKIVVDWLEPLGTQGTRRLSKGTFALQAHDPGSEVRYRAVRVKPLPDGDGAPLTRADRVSLRRHLSNWWERMDYGPFVTSVVDLAPDRSVFKGITIELDPERSASYTFDTDLLLGAAGWAGPLRLTGTPFDGAHGPQPSVTGTPWFTNPVAAGWAHDGNHLDQRPIASGPLPKGRARWRGLSRHGEEVVLRYDVGEAALLELPDFEAHDGIRSITRTFALGKASHPLSLLVAAEAGARTVVSEKGRLAVMQPAPLVPPAGRDAVVTLVDRTSAGWDDLAMGAPVAGDLLDPARTPAAKIRFVEGFTAPSGNSGAVGDLLPRLGDGELPTNADEPGKVVFFDGGTGRVHVDLGEERDLTRINTYSWHRADRAVQRFTLWGSKEATADPKGADLASAGWTKIAEVDSSALGEGGKHGSSVTNLAGLVGRYRSLLLELPDNRHDQGTFLAELDLFVAGETLPALKEPHARGDRRPLTVAIVDGPAAAHLVRDGERLRLEVPAAALPCSLKLALTREAIDATAKSFASLPRARDLAALRNGGPSLWPETLATRGVQAQDGDAPYVVDDIPLPFANPWESSLRFGGFDFFKDGQRAALSTWNGDVWIVSGIGGPFGEMRWKRFAAGLFETLGLAIVDDVVYVHGRDQITRLHDLNGDGEADDYECFNNDVYTTRNFHEFAFDLQTDRAGNFYFSKAGPVRPGGRGFDAIVPHNGTVLKLSKDGRDLSIYSTGLRAPNGIGVGPDGQVTAGDNEGTWVPHCKLHWLAPGSFQGVADTAHSPSRPTDYTKPLCWFPMGVDNSGGGQAWVTSDRFGPFGGDLLHLSYGQSSIYKVMKEEVDGQVQGGVFRLPVTLGSSAMRARFHPGDGQLYVCGLKGWQTNAARLSAFQRVRYTGAPVRMPKSLQAVEGGLIVEFTCPLDPELAGDVQSYALEQWNYVWGPMYGSPEVSVRNADPKFLESAQSTEQQSVQQHDKVAVTAARLLDAKRVFLTIPDLLPAMQCHLKVDLESADGQPMAFDLWHTIHALGAKPAEVASGASGAGGGRP